MRLINCICNSNANFILHIYWQIMNDFAVSFLLLTLFLVAPKHLLTKTTERHNTEAWTYEEAGSWGGLCQSGERQSPIDIRTDWFNDNKTPKIKFINYHKSGNVTMANNGHTVVVSGFDKWAEQPQIAGGGLANKYALSQFHFHWSQNGNGSEHTVDGRHFNAELHFVHVKKGVSFLEASELSDGIAVLGIFFKIGHEGHALLALQNGLSKVTNDGEAVQIELCEPSALLPADLGTFFRYSGSLTTPKCNEAVLWTVFAEPMPISEEQMRLLCAINGHNGKPISANVRPVQHFSREAQKYNNKVPIAVPQTFSGPI